MRALKFVSIEVLLSEAVNAFRRFPGVILTSFVCAALGIWYIEYDVHFDDTRAIFSAALGLPLFLAAAFWRESKGWTGFKHKVIEVAAGGTFLLLHFFLNERDDTYSYFYRYMQLSLILHLLVSFVAYWRDTEGNGFWQLNKAIFLRILASFAYAGVFFVGLVIALFAIDNLFKVKIRGDIYGELWVLSAFVLQTWHFVAGLPRNLALLRAERGYPRGLRVFVQYLLIPLVTLYMVILYAYMGKVIIQWKLPSGYIAWLVSIMSVLGMFNLLLIDPEKDRSESAWIKFYSKAYYILILPLLGLLFVAVGARISAYGFTMQRYAVLVLGMLLAVLAVYFIFSRRKDIRLVPISLALVTLITMWGPQSMFSVSLRSQMNRSQALMEKHGLFKDGKAQSAKGKDIGGADFSELRSSLEYILKYYGPNPLRDWFPAETLASTSSRSYGGRYYNDSYKIMDFFEISRPSAEHYSRGTFVLKIDAQATELSGYQNAVILETYSGKTRFRLGQRTFTVDRLDDRVEVNEGPKTLLRIPLIDAIKRAKGVHGTDNEFADPKMLYAEAENELMKARLAIHYVSVGYESDSEELKVYSLSGALLFNLKK